MKSISDELDEILRDITTTPYPDYNLGLLPDEDGYDEHKIERVYNFNEMIDQAKQAILALFNKHVEELLPDGMPVEHLLKSSTLKETNHQIKGYNQALDDIKAKLKE